MSGNSQAPEDLEDSLELRADPSARVEIDRAREEIAKGGGVRADELIARYLRDASGR